MDHKVQLPVAENERSQNKELCISLKTSSMPVETEAMTALVDRIYASANLSSLIKYRTINSRQKAEADIKKRLTLIVWHLYLAANVDPDAYVRLSLNHHEYKAGDPFNPHGFTKKLIELVHRLRDEKVIQYHVGFSDKASRQTRIRAPIGLLKCLVALPANIQERPVPLPVVKIKDRKTKKPVPFEFGSDETVRQNVKTLKAYNELLAKHDIRVKNHTGRYIHITDKNGHVRCVNVTQTHTFVVFHKDERGTLVYGRKHGGFWQFIPSKLRGSITIDGQDTVEFDYSAQVLNILASHSNVQLSGDPYDIPFQSPFSAEFSRNMVKKAVVIATNSKSRSQAITALQKALRDEADKSDAAQIDKTLLTHLYESLFRHHPFLEGFSFKSLGMHVFALDGEIARLIMQRFVDQRQVVLPIHDGFITTKKNAQFLRDTMKQVWHEAFGTTIGIKPEPPIVGLTSTPQKGDSNA